MGAIVWLGDCSESGLVVSGVWTGEGFPFPMPLHNYAQMLSSLSLFALHFWRLFLSPCRFACHSYRVHTYLLETLAHWS